MDPALGFGCRSQSFCLPIQLLQASILTPWNIAAYMLANGRIQNSAKGPPPVQMPLEVGMAFIGGQDKVSKLQNAVQFTCRIGATWAVQQMIWQPVQVLCVSPVLSCDRCGYEQSASPLEF